MFNIFENTELLNFPAFLCGYHIYYDLKMKVFPWSLNIFWDLVNTVLLNRGYFFFFFTWVWKYLALFHTFPQKSLALQKKKKQIIIYSRIQHFGSFYRNNSGTLICWRGVCVCVLPFLHLPLPLLCILKLFENKLSQTNIKCCCIKCCCLSFCESGKSITVITAHTVFYLSA